MKIEMRRDGNKIIIGDSSQLIVDLENQENYIRINDKMIPYRKKVELSGDLLAGKRQNVLETAVGYYYEQACSIAEGLQIAKAYRQHANTAVREIK